MSFNDLEQGRPRAEEGTSEEFQRLAEQVGLHNFRITSNVKTLRQLESRLRQPDTDGLGKRLYGTAGRPR